jgi:hypothetical protein
MLRSREPQPRLKCKWILNGSCKPHTHTHSSPSLSVNAGNASRPCTDEQAAIVPSDVHAVLEPLQQSDQGHFSIPASSFSSALRSRCIGMTHCQSATCCLLLLLGCTSLPIGCRHRACTFRLVAVVSRSSLVCLLCLLAPPSVV